MGNHLVSSILKSRRRRGRRHDPARDRVRQRGARRAARASGEPYVTHPIAVAADPRRARHRPVAIQAALLHDVPEDTEYALSDIEERFGAEVAQLVDGVTKLVQVQRPCATSSSRPRTCARCSWRWPRTSASCSSSSPTGCTTCAPWLRCRRRSRRASPTRPWRSTRRWPSASASGRSSGSSRTSRSGPRARQATASSPRSSTPGARPASVHRAGDRRCCEPRSRRPASRPTSPGRPKHIYSIYQEDAAQAARSFDEIYDVLRRPRPGRRRPRLLRAPWASCTRSGGRSPASSTTTSPCPRTTATSRSTPRSSRWTASPSRSRSAPTRCTRSPSTASPRTGATRKARRPTASTTPSSPGCASSWTGSATSPTPPSSWSASRSTSSRTRSSSSRRKGDIKDLPAGATPLDFAYRIHTDVGHTCIGAKVNNRLVPLDYKLQERRHRGDRHHARPRHGPSRDWLNMVTHRPRAARRSGSGSSASSATRTSSTAARRSTANCAGWPGPRSRASARTSWWRSPSSYNYATRRRLLSRRSGYGAVSAQSVVMKLGVVDDTRSTVLPPVAPPPVTARAGWHPGQGRRRRARPLRQVLPPDPGRPDPGLHHPGQGRDGPPARPARRVVNERDVYRLIDVEWEMRPRPDLPHRDPRRGVRPHRPPLRHHATSSRRRRSTSSPRTCPSTPTTRPRPARRSRWPRSRQLARVLAAHRAAQGRQLGPARPRLTHRLPAPARR